jgi:hypothetical protein
MATQKRQGHCKGSLLIWHCLRRWAHSHGPGHGMKAAQTRITRSDSALAKTQGDLGATRRFLMSAYRSQPSAICQACAAPPSSNGSTLAASSSLLRQSHFWELAQS